MDPNPVIEQATAYRNELASRRSSTAAQRRALYRMGRSRTWVHRYCRDRTTAARIVGSAIGEMHQLKGEANGGREDDRNEVPDLSPDPHGYDLSVEELQRPV